MSEYSGIYAEVSSSIIPLNDTIKAVSRSMKLNSAKPFQFC